MAVLAPPPFAQASTAANHAARTEPAIMPAASPGASQGEDFVPLPPLFLATTEPNVNAVLRIDSPPQLPPNAESTGIVVPEVVVAAAPLKSSLSASTVVSAATSPAIN